MEEKFRVFPENYNKMLDLVEKIDPDLVKKYEKIMTKMPNFVLNHIKENRDFSCDGTDFRVDLDKYDEMIEFQYTRYKKYFNASMNIYPYYEDELLEDDEDETDEEVEVDPELVDERDGDIFIFSLTMTNTEDEAKIRIDVEEKDGNYQFKGVGIKGVEIDHEVFVEKREDGLYLTSRQTLNGVQVYKKEMPMDFEELAEYACEESEEEEVDDYEEDFEDYPEISEIEDSDGEWQNNDYDESIEP